MSTKPLPAGLSLEKPAKNLASLITTDALRGMTSTVLTQWDRADAFAELARYGIRPIDRMLFYGPPGNGKTMAAQWLAEKIEAPLYRVRCEALITKWMGETSERVSAVMAWLEQQSRCVVLFDEVEQILPSRTQNLGGVNREINSAMTVFWQYLDRWEAPTLFILATNMPDRLDQALLSRIDLQIEFGPPTADQASNLIRYWQEVLHEYGSDQWAPALLDRGDFPSFRALFHQIQHHVRQHVTSK